VISWLLGMALAADCDTTTQQRHVRESLDEAYRQLEALDITAFKAATDRLDGVLPCLSEALQPRVIAEIHRTKGIRAFGERDPMAELMFAAARTIEPGYRFPTTLVPEGNPIRTTYQSVDTSSVPREEVPRPGSGDLRIDGYSSNQRPTSWPTLVQYLEPNGSVGFTAYLAPDEPIPDYPLVPPPPDPAFPMPLPVPTPAPQPQPQPQTSSRSARVPLLVAAGVTGIGASIAYGMAGAGHRKFNDPTTPDSELDALRGQTNTLVLVGAFGGVATVGLTIAGLTSK